MAYKYWQTTTSFSFLRFNSNGITWIFSGSLKLDIILDGNEDLMYTNIPPRLLVMSNLMGSWKPGIKNCELGKEGSNLVSATERMSNCSILDHKDYQAYFG